MEEMKCNIDSCFRNKSRGFRQTYVAVLRHAKEVPWIMEIMALQDLLFADVFSYCPCRTVGEPQVPVSIVSPREEVATITNPPPPISL